MYLSMEPGERDTAGGKRSDDVIASLADMHHTHTHVCGQYVNNMDRWDVDIHVEIHVHVCHYAILADTLSVHVGVS